MSFCSYMVVVFFSCSSAVVTRCSAVIARDSASSDEDDGIERGYEEKVLDEWRRGIGTYMCYVLYVFPRPMVNVPFACVSVTSSSDKAST